MGLAGLGLALRPRRQQDGIGPTGRLGTVVLVSAAAYFTVASVVTVAVPRLRAPFDLVCCLGVGVLVAVVSGRRRTTGPIGPTEEA